ncbi:major facilitator superfamily domain-containing protein [Dioszegia hungarica]|uniref:Major facilitator superfamily domain-containing protein n=1 Tax=Dioszegia hungarica TaxID=4972 RepID=A0AA38LRB4_9TREE|nr:major facilitator superfamily domain-containing protein [Dioszegia hungarica]KAI9634257.1 major facilitator superfamily domain-containing protein [Dioszegia hungarica]
MSALANDTETQPLLAKDPQRRATPLPKFQLALICFLRITEPIAFLVCFPFLNQMLLDVGAVDDPKDVGWPAGIIESIFSITQLTTVFYWGSLSDRWGRKPILIIGSIGSAISAIMFGFSKSLTMMIVTRSFNGLMNGNVAVLKCIMAEICDETNESRAFSLFPVMLNLGTLIASYVGGEYANVGRHYPNFANTFPIFKTYPYLLPCLIAGLFPLLSSLAAFIWLEETLPPPSISSDPDAVPDEPEPLKDIFTTKINLIMVSFGVLSLMGSAIMGIHPLFCFTPAIDGGLGFSEKNIGNAMSVRAVLILVVQLVAFPWLQRKIGTWRLYKILMFFWIPTFLGLPFVNLIARGGNMAMVWVSLTLTLVCAAIGNMAFVCNLLMVNQAAPSRRSLGAINGYSQVVSSFVRTLGPGGASILFAVSIDKQIWGGNLIWVVCTATAVIGVWSGLVLRK